MTAYDVAIIGAGPYGLSAARHLRTMKGLDVRVFGKPMSFWDENMPAGMFLRSNWTATQIADPACELTLEAFQASTGRRFHLPVPISDFVEYGLWYQRQAVPDVDPRKVVRVESDASGFRLHLVDGEALTSRRLIIAAGICSFARRPPEFDHLPAELASHTSVHRDFRTFAGKHVLVVGGGQSALESGALLHEAGAKVEVVSRAARIHWLQGVLSKTLHHRLGKVTRNLLYAPTDVGPAVISQLLARPDLVRRLPRAVQDKLRRRATRPAGARWLVDRLKNVNIRLNSTVASASASGDHVEVRLNDGTLLKLDHVFLGTGYKIDVAKYEFLAPELIQSIRRSNGFPVLKEGLESSVSGLHILGAPAIWSFGPLMQFVSGSRYASRAVFRSITGKESQPA